MGGKGLGFAPEMTSERDGSDCRCAVSFSSDGRRGSTGEIMPAMLGPGAAEWLLAGYEGGRA